MVTRPDEYHWSSYHANANVLASGLITQHPLYLNLGDTQPEWQARYRSLFAAHIDPVGLKRIRDVTQQGLALGNDKFLREVEKLAGRRARLAKRGPRPKGSSEGEFLL